MASRKDRKLHRFECVSEKTGSDAKETQTTTGRFYGGRKGMVWGQPIVEEELDQLNRQRDKRDKLPEQLRPA
ncbi:hypothetical protein ZHAS_00020505 [Anopheles sinensis]|uniref:Uncharacterized protein n=1 Tax=Anopheles sinensis TaxID=74873 RepID=A0A084WQ13_ANOSI|nr:hypothetical protein ZHAS_00020505 [Anopheles sinensis]